jgi:hypothetical protein
MVGWSRGTRSHKIASPPASSSAREERIDRAVTGAEDPSASSSFRRGGVKTRNKGGENMLNNMR